MKSKIYPAAALIAVMCFSAVYLSARESYEDYRDRRTQHRDRSLTDEKRNSKDDFRDELRGVVREEVNTSIAKEKEARDKRVDQDKVIQDVRLIVREEIEDAIKLTRKVYLKKGTLEAGGFFSVQFKGLDSSAADNNFIVKVFPTINYFIGDSIAISLKGDAEFNITNSTQRYNAGIGPMFAYGLTKDDDICFYAAIYAGISMNSANSNRFGFRYTNELGFKFVMSSGVILNIGGQIIFDNSGTNVQGFQNLFVPTIGITAWF